MFYVIHLNKLHLATRHNSVWVEEPVSRIATMMYPLQLAVILTSLVGQLNEAVFKGIKSDFVLLKKPYTFPGNASICARAEWSKSSPTKAVIAKYENQIFQIEEDFLEEFAWNGKHLLLKSAKFPDRGYYEFVCDGVKDSLKLDVFYTINVNAAEMDSITLDCHADSANDVTWLHNSERVMHYKKDGSMNLGKGYEGRGRTAEKFWKRENSLEKNCFKIGDISLTITGVRKTDAGVYRCFVDDGTTEGYPHAYALTHVNEKRSSPGNQTDSNCNEAQSLTIVFGLSTVIISIILMLVIVKPKMNCKSTSAEAPDHVPNSDENDLLVNTTSPRNDSHSMVSLPVQESDTTENKNSSTTPF